MSLESVYSEAKRSTSTLFTTNNDMAKAESETIGSGNVNHLVVMIHGLWGNPVHLHHLRDTLAAKHPNDGLHLFTPKSNADSNTYDGIEVGGERIAHEVEQTLEDLRKKETKITKISIIGYSMGGLIARYVVGVLYKAGLFDHIQPTNFTTFATPHLGVRTPRNDYRAETWNWLGSKTLSTSGQQMFLVDNFRGTGRCLLDVMADPDSIFVKGLKMFKKRSMYGNTINDRSVPFYTACISRYDPYADLDAVDLHFLPTEYEGQKVVLDPENPVTPRRLSPEQSLALQRKTLAERFTLSESTKKSLPFFAVFFTLLPIAVPVFLINAGYQTYYSARRIQLHEAGGLVDLKRYRLPILEDAQLLSDHAAVHLNTNTAEQYLPTPPPELSTSSSVVKVAGQDKSDVEAQSPFPTLALRPEQFRMIDNLDRHVGFTKYPCHIHKVHHTHAAIVLRVQKESFEEGRAVSAHWASQFEV